MAYPPPAGKLSLSNNLTEWHTFSTHSGETAGFSISDAVDLTFTGGGEVDGQGYKWWWEVLLGGPTYRPHMFSLRTVTNLLVENLLLRNSPQFHLRLYDLGGCTVRDVTIHVDVIAQKDMLRKAGHITDAIPIPTFPLNTGTPCFATTRR